MSFLAQNLRTSQSQHEKNKIKNNSQYNTFVKNQIFLGIFYIAIVNLTNGNHGLQQEATFNQASINLCSFILQ